MNHKGTKLGTGDWRLGAEDWEKILPITYTQSPIPKLLSLLLGIFSVLVVSPRATAQSMNSVVVVNSNQDGAIQPDEALTLREAIAIVNGQLSIDRLSDAEKALVKPLTPGTPSRIEFNLPPEQTIIRLTEELPPLASPGVVVDGTTQPGYDATRSATAEIAIPIPVVVITPAPDHEILRGLTIVADRVSVRGLSLYGFGDRPQGQTLNIPPADIFIAQQRWELGTSQGLQLEGSNQPSNPQPSSTTRMGTDARINTDNSSVYPSSNPSGANLQPSTPKDVVIEQNWLGIPPDERMPSRTSAFGVSVFNSLGTTIRRNRIANHEGSGIITSVQAKNLLVTENIIVGNGIAGMPDAIRLEGVIDNSQINGNLICGNDGSGVYLFKPEGAVQIRDNQITFNGRRLRRAAVYLMGDGNQVINNQIAYQTGPGVVVTSYPKSDRNIIEGNRFAGLEGLSIDLNTQQNVDPSDFQRGDGPNPPPDSPNRRKETGNSAINAPQFISSEFFVLGSQVKLFGKADPGSTVEIYRVRENTAISYGPLSESLTTVTTDDQGQFSVTLNNLQPGDKVSAIATNPQYGTSEPALNAVVQSPDELAGRQLGRLADSNQPSNLPTFHPSNPVIPKCPPAPPPPPPAPPEAAPPPEPLKLRVPRNVHFALDQATITPTSAAILDQIAAVLRSYDFLTVEIQGHTDPRASDAYNQDLSNRRALAVRNYLLRQGIAPERMTIRALGKTQRLTTGTDSINYARDRRVEFVFQDARGLEIIFEDQEEDLQVEPTGGTK